MSRKKYTDYVKMREVYSLEYTCFNTFFDVLLNSLASMFSYCRYKSTVATFLNVVDDTALCHLYVITSKREK